MERDLHPSEVSLFVAVALRGLRLEDTQDGLYRVVRGQGASAEIVLQGVGFKEVANLCGATGTLTLREAAERDGLRWPHSAEAFLALMKKL